MKKTINKKVYNTETATQFGVKYVGEFGQADGLRGTVICDKDEAAFHIRRGGTESKYVEPAIELCTEKQAKDWLNENMQPTS
jgi:hypothetical protein